MWHIVRAELDYHKKLFLGFWAFIPFLCLYEIAASGERKGYVLITVYMMTVFWNILRNKEKRHYQQARLPLAAREIAKARILMILLAGVVAAALYYVTYLLLNFRRPDEAIKLLAYLGIMLLGFSIYFVLHDLSGGAFRKFGLSKSSIKIALILIALGLLVMTIYAIIQTKATGKPHVLLHYLDKVNMLADPPANDYEIVAFLILSLALAYTTIFTYSRRKSYLE